MTATNHALTGALIGLTIANPFVALPLALLSHFVLDAMPHFGFADNEDKWLKSKAFKRLLIVEALICFGIVLTLAIARPEHWLIAAICAFIAASPDLISANRYYSMKTNRPWKPSLYTRFAGGIQWFERPIGAVTEVAWGLAMVLVLRLFI